MATVLMPIPDMDFDPTEVAVSWQVLSSHGHSIVFSTESGRPAVADEIMVSGRGLDIWSKLPGLSRVVVVGRFLRADRDGRAAYANMLGSTEYQHPAAWTGARLDDVDAVLLPGGHRARGMRSYIDSEILQGLVVDAFRRGMLVAAICHGVLLAARSVDPSTGRSVLYGRETTALTWDLERRAWQIARLTRFWDPDYYRTYPERAGEPVGYMSVEAEVTRALEKPSDFCNVPKDSPHRRKQTWGMVRDTATDPRPAFVVDDGTYISARWPGDTHTFASAVSAKLSEKP
ncbi:MAG TPA: type 1 glutamine amidotransferase domain-containing protein [Mycobacterium sp.]|nr:type 1 glutamine amidotransferase domain-containing protein [Mycobacterium sp.]